MENNEGIWELEFIKCHTKKNLIKYIQKYKDNPNNPYVKLAEAKLRVLNSDSSVNDLNIKHDIISILGSKGLYASIGILAGIALLVFFATSIKQGLRDNFQEQQQERFKAQFEAQQQAFENNRAQFEKWLSEYEQQVSKITSETESASTNTSNVPGERIFTNYPYPYSDNNITDNVSFQDNNSNPTENNNRWISFYNESYSHLANTAESAYKSLTALGATWKMDGERYGVTGRDDVWISQQIFQFQKMQHDLRDIRHEAATKGITIQEAPVESYNIE